MELRETSFTEFWNWCQENKRERFKELPYMTYNRLKIIYDYCVKHKMKCSGPRCTVKWKGNEFISSFSEPISHTPTRDDYVWNMFHEVWCKTEWAVRCGRHETELGYSAVKSEFGRNIIKELKIA